MDYGDIAQAMVNNKELKKTDSNIITLYHGSNHEVGQPVFGKGKSDNDYGSGFYTTEDKDLAKEWSGLYGNYQHCVLNTYTIDTANLNILRLNDSDYLEWLAILINNRKADAITNANDDLILEYISILNKTKYIDLSQYDCVIGWRADDSYFSFVEDYVFGRISTGKFIQAIKLGGLGLQFACLSKKAFETIKFIGAEQVNYSIWSQKAKDRDRRARSNYSRIKSDHSSLFSRQFMDEIRDLSKEVN